MGWAVCAVQVWAAPDAGGWSGVCVGVGACSVGRHAFGWPGGYALYGYDTNVPQFGSACGMCFGRIGEHRVLIAALPMIWNGWA